MSTPEPRFRRGFHLTRRENLPMSLGRPSFVVATEAGITVAVLYGEKLEEHAKALHYNLDWGRRPDDEFREVVGHLQAKQRELDDLRSLAPGIEGIAAERRRQIEGEGYTEGTDDLYVRDQLVGGAMSFLWNHWFNSGVNGRPPVTWPWDGQHWKPKDRRRDLERAGALIAAELARMDREEAAHG